MLKITKQLNIIYNVRENNNKYNRYIFVFDKNTSKMYNIIKKYMKYIIIFIIPYLLLIITFYLLLFINKPIPKILFENLSEFYFCIKQNNTN